MNPIQTIGVIGAMDKEIELLKNALHHLQTYEFGQTIVYTGELSGKKICLSLSGIGKVNAAVATALLIRQFQPDVVVNTGSAGALAADLAVGDVVIGTAAAHHDVDVTAFGYEYGQVPRLPACFSADNDLIERVKSAVGGQPVRTGLVVSGDQFIHDQAVRADIIARFPDAQVVEMEAAAIAQTCHVLSTPFVIVRAVSDTADGVAAVSFETFLETAAVNSAEMVRRLIQAA